MLNNKGLVVSSVLYTLLIAFLLFLGVTLAQFSSSTKLISNSTKDLVNNYEFKGEVVYEVYSGKNCGAGKDYAWHEKYKKNQYGEPDFNVKENSTTLVRIYSRYGTTFWPRDFSDLNSLTNSQLVIESCTKKDSSGNSQGSISNCGSGDVITYVNSGPYSVIMKVKDKAINQTTDIEIYNPCG